MKEFNRNMQQFEVNENKQNLIFWKPMNIFD